MVKIGLLGVGHLGKVHLKCLQEINSIEIIGFFDPDETGATAITLKYPSIRRFDSAEALIDQSDAIDIVTPTVTHFELAEKAIKKKKHVFIEKPLTQTPEEALTLIQLAQKYKVCVQVGFVERFNPAFLSIQHLPLNPMFIEAHRLSLFNPRGTDVSVVLDLMIHDLDLILSLIKAPLASINASGVSVVSSSPDIANARLEFKNGAVANLTASRISLKQMRKLRIFQKEAYISLNLLNKEAQIVRLFNEKEKHKLSNKNMISLETEKGKKYIDIEQTQAPSGNAIKMELEAFTNTILQEKPSILSIEEAYLSLKVAHQISHKITERSSVFSS